MAQAIKTVEFPFETRLTTLATNTTLGTATEHTFSAVTVGLPESSKTIRAAWLQVTHNMCTTTTARRLDGIRIGVQIDAVAFNDGTDLTGTGIAQSGDPYSHYADRDVTSYFVTNYTGTSHTVGVRVRFEHDVADVVQNITCKLYITYEYDDASATQVKTVRIPLEGITGFLGTTANTNIRGTAASGQIPNLDTFLPETSKTYRQIWFEIHATDGGAAVTDFNLNVAIDSGSNARTTIEGGLNGSARYFDIWIQNSMTTNATHDFQAWSSLASRFETLYAVLHVTYEFASSSTTIINSLLIPIRSNPGYIPNTTAADNDVWETEFWIEEPATVTMVQSAAWVFFGSGNATAIVVNASGAGSAGGAQGTTTITYNAGNFTQSGTRSICHRLDLAHGGTDITLGRGRNKLRLYVYSTGASFGQIVGLGGYFIINYTSGKASSGIGSHNVTTRWMLADVYSDGIGGALRREIATTNQRTPNIPQSNYFLNTISTELNTASTSTISVANVNAEVVSGEFGGIGDGWSVIDTVSTISPEFGWSTFIFTGRENWRHYPSEPIIEGADMDPEANRKYRITMTSTFHCSLIRVITTHAITYTVSGDITGSSGGTVTIDLYSDVSGLKLASTSRVGNGSYSLTWYDNTENVFTVARESSTLLGRSERALAGT